METKEIIDFCTEQSLDIIGGPFPSGNIGNIITLIIIDKGGQHNKETLKKLFEGANLENWALPLVIEKGVSMVSSHNPLIVNSLKVFQVELVKKNK